MNNLRTKIGVSLLFLISIGAYMFLPFIWVYGISIGISVALMIADLIQRDLNKV